MSAVLASLALAAEQSPSTEGKHIIVGMLIVGLVFLSVIALGQTLRYLSHRREARRAARRRAY